MAKAQTFVSVVYDARKKSVIDRLRRLELQSLIQIEVAEDLLAQRDRLESRIQATTVTNQPTVDAVNTLRVDFNKILEQRSSLPNRPTQNWTST